jgi:hypothetical protein
MEMSYGNFLYSYVKQTKMSFFYIKLENKSAEQVVPGGWYQWVGEDVGNGVGGEYGANAMYTYM